MKKLLTIIAAVALCVSAYSQTNTPPDSGSFLQSVTSYFTTFNTNLDSTFGTERGSIWTGVDSIQGGDAPLANSLGLSYNIWKAVSAESVLRNSGVAGTVLSEQAGFGLSFIVHDAKLTLYADAGYNFQEESTKFEDKLFGELGIRAEKALTTHTFLGVGMGVRVPNSEQVFTAFGGFTF